jgi:lysophospholipase L1-like esterase
MRTPRTELAEGDHRMKKRSLGTVLRAVALAGTVLLGACVGDGDEVLSPRVPLAGGELFQRYVSLGNSITAGYQSDGINDSTQVRAYPVLLAERAGAEFYAPLVMRPGCPRPFRSPLGATGRVTAASGDTTSTCVRINNPPFVSNLAVPGERIGDLLTFPAGNVGKLHTLLVGPNTQLQAMTNARPSLVSVWIGNNDALQAGLSGNLALLTPTALFAARADSVLDAIQAAAPRDAIVIGVINPSIAPLLQRGAYFHLAYIGEISAGRPSPFGRPVNANCAPGTPGGARQVSLAIASQATTGPGAIAEVSCAADAPFVLNEEEATTLTASVNAFNTALQQGTVGRRPDGGNWLYIDPMAILNPFVNDPARLRKCQGLATATTPAQFQAAVTNTCPSLTAGFGSLISFDGVHPSSAAHVIIANYVAAQLNTRYGLTLPTS